MAEHLQRLAEGYLDARRLADVRRALERALELVKDEQPPGEGLAMPVYYLGVLAYEGDRDGAALAYWEKTLQIWQKTRSADDPQLSQVRALVAELEASVSDQEPEVAAPSR